MRRRFGKGDALRPIGASMTERGALSIPMALLLCVAAIGFSATWRTFQSWHEIRDRQLGLDECVTKNALETAARLNRVRKLDSGIRATRAALWVAVEPSIRASLSATLQALGAWVRVEEAAWASASALWLLRRGCGNLRSSLPRPYPQKPWINEPPDPIGPRPLTWKEQHGLQIQLLALPRSSRAWVVRRSGRWSAQWRPASPRPSSS